MNFRNALLDKKLPVSGGVVRSNPIVAQPAVMPAIKKKFMLKPPVSVMPAQNPDLLRNRFMRRVVNTGAVRG